MRPVRLLSALLGTCRAHLSTPLKEHCTEKGEILSLSAQDVSAQKVSALKKRPKNGLKIWLANMDSNHD